MASLNLGPFVLKMPLKDRKAPLLRRREMLGLPAPTEGVISLREDGTTISNWRSEICLGVSFF